MWSSDSRRSKSYRWILRAGLFVLFFVLLFLEPAITFASPLVGGRARKSLDGVASTPRVVGAAGSRRRGGVASVQPGRVAASSNPAQVGDKERRVLLGMSIVNDFLLLCFLWELFATHLGLFLFEATVLLATWIVAARADLVASPRRRRGFHGRTRR